MNHSAPIDFPSAASSLRSWLAAGVLLCVSFATSAAEFSGHLGDAGNTALVGSDLGVATFGDANAVANNVALYQLVVGTTGLVTITSSGFAAGGVDPYFSIFTGFGGAATFLDSNDDQATSIGGDFTYAATLAAGKYTLTLGSFENLSFAEQNDDSGTLADGFTGLGDPNSLRSGYYRLTVTTASAPIAPVPEPAGWALLGLGLGVLLLRKTATHMARA